MKRLKYAVILLLGLSMATMMTSCNKESNYQNRIIGKWHVTKDAIYTYDLSGTLLNEYVDDDDYNFEFFGGSVKGNYPWKSDDDYYMISYEITENTLYFFAFGVVQGEFKILEITNSTMVWEREYESGWYYDEELQHDISGSFRKVERIELKKVN